MALFEGYERRVDKINAVLAEYGMKFVGQDYDDIPNGGFKAVTAAAEKSSALTNVVYLKFAVKMQGHAGIKIRYHTFVVGIGNIQRAVPAFFLICGIFQRKAPFKVG